MTHVVSRDRAGGDPSLVVSSRDAPQSAEALGCTNGAALALGATSGEDLERFAGDLVTRSYNEADAGAATRNWECRDRLEVFGWKGKAVSARLVGMRMDTELQKHYALF